MMSEQLYGMALELTVGWMCRNSHPGNTDPTARLQQRWCPAAPHPKGLCPVKLPLPEREGPLGLPGRGCPDLPNTQG